MEIIHDTRLGKEWNQRIFRMERPHPEMRLKSLVGKQVAVLETSLVTPDYISNLFIGWPRWTPAREAGKRWFSDIYTLTDGCDQRASAFCCCQINSQGDEHRSDFLYKWSSVACIFFFQRAAWILPLSWNLSRLISLGMSSFNIYSFWLLDLTWTPTRLSATQLCRGNQLTDADSRCLNIRKLADPTVRR